MFTSKICLKCVEHLYIVRVFIFGLDSHASQGMQKHGAPRHQIWQQKVQKLEETFFVSQLALGETSKQHGARP